MKDKMKILVLIGMFLISGFFVANVSAIDVLDCAIDDDCANGQACAEGICIEEISDADSDGIADDVDNCPNFANPEQEDVDGDGVGDVCDNCPNTSNPEQEYDDEDGVGDVCEDEIPPQGSILINGGATHTNSRNVVLTLEASDDSGVDAMKIANHTSYHDWEEYVTSKSWQLTDGDAEKTVRVIYRDGVGNENDPGIPATIILDTNEPNFEVISPTPENDSTITSQPEFWIQADENLSEAWVSYGSAEDPEMRLEIALVRRISLDSKQMTIDPEDNTRAYYKESGLANGEYAYTITAKDLAGNSTTSQQMNFTLDVPTPSRRRILTQDCSEVTYTEWSECVDGTQTRDILTKNPSGCKLTSAQENDKQQTCEVVVEVEDDSVDEDEIKKEEPQEDDGEDKKDVKLEGEVLGEKIVFEDPSLYDTEFANDFVGQIIASDDVLAYVNVFDNLTYRFNADNLLRFFEIVALGINEADHDRLRMAGDEREIDEMTERLKGYFLLRVGARGRITYVDMNGYGHEVNLYNFAEVLSSVAVDMTDEDFVKLPKASIEY